MQHSNHMTACHQPRKQSTPAALLLLCVQAYTYTAHHQHCTDRSLQNLPYRC